MATNVLVVDLARVLDESALGKEGAAALQRRFDEARAKHDKLKGRATTEQGKRMAETAAAQFEAEVIAEIEAERARLREQVLAKARPVVAQLLKERGAALVLDAAACLAVSDAVSDAVDVTDEVLRRLA